MSSLDTLRQALAVSPDNVPLLLLMAQGSHEEFQIDEARSFYERVLKLETKNREGRLGLCRVLHSQGKTSEAIVRMEAYVVECPKDPVGHQLLSRLLLADGQLETARHHYQLSRQLPGAVIDAALEKELYLDHHTKMPTEEKRNKGAVTAEGWTKLEEELAAEELEDSDPLNEFMEQPTISFKEVGGMEAVKEEIRMKILYPLQNPDLFRAYGKKIGGGVLLYGPPGCGKTLLSRATAGEIKANFFSIGIHQILDLYIGESEKNLHRIFEMARENTPAVLFFDEVDALAADRADLRKSAGRTLINQFLSEMDGTTSDNEGLLILGATNAPWHIDPAFRRPGRFDRVLFVPPPDEEARLAVIQVMAQGKPIADLDAKALAQKTKDFSGADLKAVFDLAIEHGLAAAMKKGQIVPITTKDLLEAVKLVRPSCKAWFESAKNYALYSNQGGFYNDVLTFLGIKK